jgi:hypothetical protein
VVRRIFALSATVRREAAGCEDAGVTPKDVVARWVELFNAGDADGLAALYHEDAINHAADRSELSLPIRSSRS